MGKWCVVTCFLALFQMVLGQANNPYMKVEDVKAFLNSEKMNTPIDGDAIDLELIQAALFYKLNKNKAQLTVSPTLDSIGEKYVRKINYHSFEKSKLKIFQTNRLTKRFNREQYRGKFRLVKACNTKMVKKRRVGRVVAINYNKPDSVCTYHTRKRGKLSVPLKWHTYNSLTNAMLGHARAKYINPGYSEVSIQVQPDRRTIRRRGKLPSMQVLMLFVGYRLKKVEEEKK